jgi:nitroreductase
MELIEAIQRRRSIRAFTDKQVPKEIIMEILNVACRAPSAMNTQPWEFIVVTGEKLTKLRAAIVEQLKKGAPIVPDHQVVGWPKDSVYTKRQISLAKQLFKAMDILREDMAKRTWWLERGFRFFDAPVAIIIATDKILGESAPLLDLGAVMQNICLAALDFGLGTCIEDQGVMFPEAVREHTDISPDKRLMIAMAIGYPDDNFPANQVRSERETAENLTTWVE